MRKEEAEWRAQEEAERMAQEEAEWRADVERHKAEEQAKKRVSLSPNPSDGANVVGPVGVRG